MSHDGDSHVEEERFPAGRWLEHKRRGDLHLPLHKTMKSPPRVRRRMIFNEILGGNLICEEGFLDRGVVEG